MKGDSLISRRDFLREASTGLTGAAFLALGACSSQTKEKSQKAGSFIVRTLGKTGLRLPIVSMGSSYAVNLVRTALDEGIVYIHTSSGYSERNHERLLGEVFRDRPRDSFVVATSPDLPYQFGRRNGRSLDLGTGTDPNLIPKSIEGSLKRLGLDYVDIYYLASIGSRETTLHEPYLKAFEKLKNEGRTRFAGVITHSNEPEVIRAAAESGLWEVVVTAYNFRQSHRKEVKAAIGRAAKAGLGVVAMKTQAGVYWDRIRTRKINMKAALKWVLQDENVHTCIPAFSNFEEMREDLSVMEDLALTPKERRDLRLENELGFYGTYCQGCGRCLAQCPAGMDIPTIMRANMYAFSYHESTKAKDTLRHWKPSKVACESCEKCEVDCALGLDVKAGVLDVARLLEAPGATRV
jgi:predicted aldo/keto reductase-like oxidoreductase